MHLVGTSLLEYELDCICVMMVGSGVETSHYELSLTVTHTMSTHLYPSSKRFETYFRFVRSSNNICLNYVCACESKIICR